VRRVHDSDLAACSMWHVGAAIQALEPVLECARAHVRESAVEGVRWLTEKIVSLEAYVRVLLRSQGQRPESRRQAARRAGAAV
jgi:hypothetical protein